MTSSCGRYVICFNGEIYNAENFRSKLINVGCKFQGRSDTEILLEACATWGVEKSIQEMIGMFSFAFWDKKKCVLTLARDRLGIKPLYWSQQGNTFIFGSELKSLMAFPGFLSRENKSVAASFLRCLQYRLGKL